MARTKQTVRKLQPVHEEVERAYKRAKSAPLTRDQLLEKLKTLEDAASDLLDDVNTRGYEAEFVSGIELDERISEVKKMTQQALDAVREKRTAVEEALDEHMKKIDDDMMDPCGV